MRDVKLSPDDLDAQVVTVKRDEYAYVVGDALGLDDGNWSFAIVADFTDADAHRAYDQDEERNRARTGLLPMTEQIARVQFEVP